MMKNHVFVSHGSEDRVQANELASFIEAKGVKSWIAPRDVRPGQDYSEQLQEAIETCSSFVVLVTDKANRSPYVRAETEMAFSTSKPIFPVRTTDIKPAAGLAFFLKIRHWTDAFGEEREANLARLARELQTFAGVAVDPTQFVADAEARGRAAATAAEPATPPPPAPPPPAPAPPPPPPPAYTAPTYTPAPPPWQSAAALMTPTQPTQQISDLSIPADPELLRAAVGPNADLYLQRWAAMDAKGSAISWNWPACLASLFWFAYRKMWLPMAGVFVAMLILSMISGSNPAFAQIAWLFSIGITFVTGAFGNYLYRQHAEKLIADTAPLGRPAQLQALAAKGGVSWPAVVVPIGVVAAIVVLSVATVGEIERKDGVTPGNDSRTGLPANGVQPVANGVGPGDVVIPTNDPGQTQPGGQSGEKPPISPDDPSFQQDEGQPEVLEEQPQQ